MADLIVDQITRLKLKLLEKRLENERAGHGETPESAFSTRSYDRRNEALHSALRRKRDLLQRLREQHMLDDLARPQTWAGTCRQHHYESLASPSPPVYIYQSPPRVPPLAPPLALPPAPQPRHITQHTVPYPPATIMQQLPQQQPLIAQIPPVQPVPHRSGSIKEDMVELMLMQNAQMHQIIMHNMMLKALPPTAAGTIGSLPVGFQDNYMKAKGAVHHHHHYGPPPLPPIGYSAWPSMMPPQSGGAYQPSTQHITGPVTLPSLNTVTVDGLKTRCPLGF